MKRDFDVMPRDVEIGVENLISHLYLVLDNLLVQQWTVENFD